jgi:hypothetical protein
MERRVQRQFGVPKTWNAAYLVSYGLLDNNNQSFHGTTDYRQLAEAPDSNFKDEVYYDATDATNIFGSFTYHWPGDNEITLSCNLFNANVSNRILHPAPATSCTKVGTDGSPMEIGTMAPPAATVLARLEHARLMAVTTSTFTESVPMLLAPSIRQTVPPTVFTHPTKSRSSFCATFPINRSPGSRRVSDRRQRLMQISALPSASSTDRDIPAVARGPGDARFRRTQFGVRCRAEILPFRPLFPTRRTN